MILTRLATTTLGLLAVIAIAGCEATTPQTLEASGVQRMVSPAEANCLAATNTQLGRNDASMISVSPSEAGTEVIMSVPGASANWKCIATSDGVVQEVFYMAEG